MDVSLYLSAIQKLNGRSPGDKFKQLHSIAIQIIENATTKSEFLNTGVNSEVQPALFPYLRILVGNKLKLADAVIEALKSDDVSINKQALSAKWFFDGSNPLLSVDYVLMNVMPYISLRTRLYFIKTLSHCLKNKPIKAQEFFDSFSELYGVDQALPLIVACGEQYIFDTILKYRIMLSPRMLNILYRKYPNLVIRYLQLGNENNMRNKGDRRLHKISVPNYIGFLPKLIKYHTQDFIELFECLPSSSRNIKLGSTRTELFLKNATDVLIKKPHIFLDLLPLKLVTNELSTTQFDNMYGNLFPKNVDAFNIETMVSYLKYYPTERKLPLLRNRYKSIFNKTLSVGKNIFTAAIFYEMLATDKKEEIGRKTIASLVGKIEYYDNLFLLPPKESIPLLKERSQKPSEKSRAHWFKQMILSCAIYDNKEDLLEVLRYYHSRHKNERNDILSEILNVLTSKFDIKTLDKEHWEILKDIMQRAYIKNDLFAVYSYTCISMFEGALYYYLKQVKFNTASNEDKIFLDKLFNIIIEGYLEHKLKWKFMVEDPDIEKDCIEKFLEIIPKTYPIDHVIWNKDSNKLQMTLELLKAMRTYNARILKITSKKKHLRYKSIREGDEREKKFVIEDYPLLLQFIKTLLKFDPYVQQYEDNLRLLEFRDIMREYFSECYQKCIDDNSELINDVLSNDALRILRRFPNKILEKWKLYLTSCKRAVQRNDGCARHFVLATKWHQEIPIKFVDQCLIDLKERGSALILGILLEGEVFSSIVKDFLPKDKKLNYNNDDSKKIYEVTSTLPRAINYTNPPAPFDIIAPFCHGDYVILATQTLTNIAQRVSTRKVLAFANGLVDQPVSIKKLGIRMVFQVSTREEVAKFLVHIWKNERNPSIREVVAKMIFDVFRQSPNNDTWKLIKICIDGLTADDETILKVLTNIQAVDKNFVALYVEEFVNRINAFTKDELSEQKKSRFMGSIVASIDENIIYLLPDDLVTNIVKQDFFSHSIIFIIKIYLFSEEHKFDERLKTLMEILCDELKKFNEPDPQLPRFYPTNRLIRSFFIEIMQFLMKNENYELNLRLINSFLELFTTILHPWQEPRTYVALTISKEFFNPIIPKTPKEFGIRCGKKLKYIVQQVSSEIILHSVARYLNEMELFKDIEKTDCKLSLIEGMMQVDDYYGSVVGISLIDAYELKNYDNRYDKFMKQWRENAHITIQTALSEHVNEIGRWHFL